MPLSDLLTYQLGNCWRIVETQEVAATREITDNADEQSRLEALLDASKPSAPDDCQGLSYLLMTPFRYPPLQYGSRFGSTWERGIFYGAAELDTAFAEAAVYFWLFQQGPTTLGPLSCIRDQRTAFSVRIASAKALDLRSAYFTDKIDSIMDPKSWVVSQQLGKEIRETEAEFFWYPSARQETGTNVAVLTPDAFSTREPDQYQHWQVRLDEETCWFGRAGASSIEFEKSRFLIDGRIPHPCL
ncbi:Uncharacterised protein [BD1-7 clade bacterium]|uniref:RES domain-containing protein n=1 Tax=BD1-7 clade bacterium TaxID=2029982 RepID=A0A5S9QWU5_9GAMM|nr:Uncharacterised protein [BD1-7 clade bacterium]